MYSTWPIFVHHKTQGEPSAILSIQDDILDLTFIYKLGKTFGRPYILISDDNQLC